jgi:hypothetical protein
MAFVLFKYPSPLEGLREAKRVLKAGGKLGISIWHGDSHSLPCDEMWENALTDIPKCPDEDDKLEELNTEQELRDILRAAGFSNVVTHRENFERTWTPETLFVLRSELSHRARLARLDEEEQNRRLEGIREQLQALAPGTFEWRPSIMFAVASVEANRDN